MAFRCQGPGRVVEETCRCSEARLNACEAQTEPLRWCRIAVIGIGGGATGQREAARSCCAGLNSRTVFAIDAQTRHHHHWPSSAGMPKLKHLPTMPITSNWGSIDRTA